LNPRPDTIVIGGGIVGVCSALYLQQEGLRVAIIERHKVGEGCSFGNAGNLTSGACVPAALPGLLRKLPRMLFDADGPVKVRPRDLPRLWPWFRYFAAASRPAAVEAISDARHSLMSRLDEAYAPLITEAGACELIKRSGLMFVFESDAGFADAQFGIELRRRRGVPIMLLSGDEAREIEPALSPSIKHAFYLPAVAHTVNPLRLTRSLVELFVRKGGKVTRAEVTDFLFEGGDRRFLILKGGDRLAFDQALVAAGVWSRELAARLGLALPLEAERGYHVMLPKSGLSLRVSLASGERAVAVTEMEDGIRASGIAEFGGTASPPDYQHADLVLRHARKILPALGAEPTSRWMGHRPAFPDSKPVIGRAPEYPSIYFAFGHYHNGLGLAAITGKLVAELMTGRKPAIDLAPFRPDRF
jgi:D-amino-acid dehydrogenase